MTIDQNTTPPGEEIETPEVESQTQPVTAPVADTAIDDTAALAVAPAPEEAATAPEAEFVPEPVQVEEPTASTDPEVLEPTAVSAVAETEAVEPELPQTADEPEPAPAPVAEPVAVVQVAEPVRSAPAEAAPANDADLFEQAMRQMETKEEAGDFKKLSKGDRVEATVIQVDRDRVFVDLGTKSEGIVPLNEITNEVIEHPDEHVKVGDKIQVIVLRPESGDGNAIVSKRMADFDKVWDRIIKAFEDGEMVHAIVVERVKGGLVVDIGVRGFVPATHVGNGKLRNIEKHVGQTLDLKIIEVDRDRKKVVLSNREAEEIRRKEVKEQLFSTVKPGDVLDGSVRRLTDYGAFVDLGGVDGLLHISEMSWMRISHPREVLKEGQKIKVMVLRIDPSANKISLGHRQVLPDPWNLIKENYTVNQRVTVKIGRLVQSGAFVKLPEGAEAFLPLSEMSNRRLRRPDEAVEEGQDVEVQIIDLRPDERRMVLSMRAIGGGATGMEFRPTSQSFDDDEMPRGGAAGKKGKKGAKGGRRGRDDDDFEELSARRGFATGGATIGERLGMLKGFKVADEDDEEESESTESTETAEVVAHDTEEA